MARTKRKVNALQPEVPAAVTSRTRRIYRTGGYIRLSVEDSGKPGADTIEAQRELVTGFIAAQEDMVLSGIYCDNGHTGTDFERPEFQRLMDDIRAGKIDCIVVKDLSRFGRNYLETGNYLERIFPFLDVRFVAVSDSFDTLTAERSSDGYIIPLKNIMNELYSRDISRKSGSALAIKQQKGEFIGSWAAYGYRKCADDSHRIEPDPETAPVVKEIFQLRLSGMSITKIVRWLNGHGIPSPSRLLYRRGEVKSELFANAVWQVATVKLVLSREVYLGHMVQGRKRSGLCDRQKQQRVPKDQWVVVRNTHPPLIDEETFQAVQSMAGKQRAAYYERLGCYDVLGSTPNILRGLVFCADCKRPLTRYKSVTGKGKKRYYVFICQSHSNDPASCPKKYIHETDLFQVLWDTLQNWIRLAADMEKLLEQYSRSASAVEQADSLADRASAARRRLSRAKMLYDSLYQNYVDRLMSETEYLELRKQYRADIKDAESKLAEVEAEEKNQQRQTSQNPWLAACARFTDVLELTEEMAHALVERIEVDADNHVVISQRYRNEYLALVRLLNVQEGVSE